MLSIRMKRLGRKGHPTYRVVVQDSRQSPTSGKFIAQLGSYDPHTKQSSLVKEKAEFYLNNGAQPSDRVVALFRAEKITLPSWVKKPSEKKRSIRNAEKLRKNQPKEEPSAEKAEEPAANDAESQPSESAAETPEVETSQDKPETDTETQQEEPVGEENKS